MDSRDPASPVDTVSWRPPRASRFDGRPANDLGVSPPQPRLFGKRIEAEAEPAGEDEPPRIQRLSDIPAWAWALFGAVIAGFLGTVIGGMMAVH